MIKFRYNFANIVNVFTSPSLLLLLLLLAACHFSHSPLMWTNQGPYRVRPPLSASAAPTLYNTGGPPFPPAAGAAATVSPVELAVGVASGGSVDE